MARAGSPDCHVDLHGETFQSGSSYPRHTKGMLDMGPAEALRYRALPRDYSHSIFNSFFNLKLNPPSRTRWLVLLIPPCPLLPYLPLVNPPPCSRRRRLRAIAPNWRPRPHHSATQEKAPTISWCKFHPCPTSNIISSRVRDWFNHYPSFPLPSAQGNLPEQRSPSRLPLLIPSQMPRRY